MFYYAEINSEYQVINKHCLAEESTNPNYISITEDLYTNGNDRGDIVGQFYNTLSGVIDKIDPEWDMGQTCWMRYKDSQMKLSTKLDNMDKATSLKADIDHTHEGYANSDDLQALEDIIDTKANISHSHSEYALVGHAHDNYITQIALDSAIATLESEIEGKADASHTHSEYASSTHLHNEYANVNHNHNSNYASLSHTHTEYVATTDFNSLESEVSGKANASHTHDNYATITSLDELSSVVSGKANASHSHNDIYYTETEIDDKLAAKADISHNHTGVYDVSGAATSALSSAKTYTDEAIDTLSETVATKANSSTLNSHTSNTTVHITSEERTNWNTAKTHADSAHAPVNAEENQNAFSNVAVGSTIIAADSKSDTITFVAGNNVTITPNSTNDSITISSANTVYTHPTTSGNKHIPAGGASGQILRWSSDGTAVWGNDNNTTYGVATQTSNGLMSSTDKTKLDGIAEGANNYVLPSAGTSLGGVKSGGNVTISSGVITVNDDSHNHVISNVDGLQSALDGKASSGHNHNDTYYTETEVDTLLSGKAESSHIHTIANITNLQSTLDAKAATSHNHDSAYISKDLQMTANNGDVAISWSGKDVVAEFKALTSGMYTAYSPVGCTNNPNATESFRFMCHKVGATTYGWVMAFGSSGSVYTGYVNGGTWQGWRAIWEYAPQPLWSGGSNGGYYMTAGHSVTPSKKLSECRNGWLLLWSDYDVGAQANNTDFATTLIPKRAYTGQIWTSAPFYCDVPAYQAGSATDSEQRVIKLLTISDTKITGAEYNATAPRNDVVLRAVYEW